MQNAVLRAPEAGRLARYYEGGADDGAALRRLGLALVRPGTHGQDEALAEDVATLVAFLVERGAAAALSREGILWSLASAPDTMRRARAMVRDNAALPEAIREQIDGFLGVFSRHDDGGLPAITPFPYRDGRPYLDTVWFEITNRCNQSCSFCPDRYRSGPRSDVSFERFTSVIDQLMDTLHVGSMQLNAYGEPLLHPRLGDMLAYLKERRVPWPTYFTTHGLTLVPERLKQLAGRFPQGIAVSLQNDSEASYAATRNTRIGSYDRLVSRVEALLDAVLAERADCHVRIYQLVCNGHESPLVDPSILSAFPRTEDRFRDTVRWWEKRAEEIVRRAPATARARVIYSSDDLIARQFREAWRGDGYILPLLTWKTMEGNRQRAFLSPRPIGPYANLIPEHHPAWEVRRATISERPCGFTEKPSLALFASGRVGLCCLNLDSTATFGAISEFESLYEAIHSPGCLRLFAELANGVATCEGCQICLGQAVRKAPSA